MAGCFTDGAPPPTAPKSVKHRKFYHGATLLFAALALLGCTSTPGPAPHAPTPLTVTEAPPPPPGATGPPAIGINTLAPVPIGASAAFRDVGLVATVTKVEAVRLAAEQPGDIAGPGVGVTLQLRNDTNAPVDLGGIVVNAYYGDRTPASPSSSAPSAPAAGLVQPGGTGSGVYAFQLPTEQVPSLMVEVNYSGSADVVLVHR